MADLTTSQSLGAAGGGILSLLQGLGIGQQNPQQIAQVAAQTADPFSGQYAGYQDQLKGLLTDPNSFKTDPGYQFALGQGQDAIKGASNATYGTGRVGGLAPELAKFTEGYAAQSYDNRINQLMNLTGAAPGSPLGAAEALTQGYQTQGNDFASGITGLLSGLGGLLGNLGKPGGVTVNNNNSANGGAGGAGGYNEVPNGGFGDYGSLTGGTNSPLWSLLGLGNTAPGNGSPIAVPGGLAGLFGTDPQMAARLGSLLGFGSNNPTNPSITNTGIPGNPFGTGGFSTTQGGGLSALFGPNGVFGSGSSSDPSTVADWTSGGDLPGGGDGSIDWNALLGGGGSGGSIDWSSLFGGTGGGSTFDLSSLFGG